jgi:membrane protein
VNFDLQRIRASVRQALWGGNLARMPRWKAGLVWVVRLVTVVLRDLMFGDLTLRAMGLVYTTLLSLVPLLAFSFSVLKGFGVHNQLEPMLRQFLQPLGAQGEEITARILGFIENLNVGVLGAVGLAFLLYTAVSLVRKTEEAINHIWHVSQPRSFSERFSSYVTILLVGPILMFTALGLTAAIAGSAQVQDILAVEPVGRAFDFFTRLVPYLLVIAAFTFIYLYMPNARARLGAALTGGVVGGVLWQSAGWAFAHFVASTDRYEAIYAGFAVLILFLIWLYVNWLVLLLGASVAFYTQHPQYVVLESGEPHLSNRMRERLALQMMVCVARHHIEGREAWTREQLSQTLHVPTHAVDAVLDALRDGGLLAESVGAPVRYLPARDLSTVSVKHLLDVVRAAGEDSFLSPANLPVPPGVEELLQRVDRATAAALGDMSVKDLALGPAVRSVRGAVASE